jgi:hypothetical protein
MGLGGAPRCSRTQRVPEDTTGFAQRTAAIGGAPRSSDDRQVGVTALDGSDLKFDRRLVVQTDLDAVSESVTARA